MRVFSRPSLALLALGGSLPACHKAEDGPTTANGRVVDSVTGQGVGGARVRLLQTARSGNILSGGASLPIDTVIADHEGAYYLAFRASEDYQYDLQANAPGYLTGSFSSQPTVAITGGRKNRKDVPIRPEGYVKVRFLAPNPGRYAGVALQTAGLPVEIFSGVNGRPQVPIDTSVVITYPGGESHLLVWAVYPGGANPYYGQNQTVYFPARDTADFTISF